MKKVTRLLFLLTLALTLCAQAPTTTNIVGTIYQNNGTTFTGTLSIQGQTFTSSGQAVLQTIETGVKITSGVVNVSLVPNLSASPPTTSYLFTFSNASAWVCIVPVSGSPVQFTTVCSANSKPPNPVVPIAVSQLIACPSNTPFIGTTPGGFTGCLAIVVSAPGVTTNQLFNDGGAIAATTNLTWNKTTNLSNLIGDFNASCSGTQGFCQIGPTIPDFGIPSAMSGHITMGIFSSAALNEKGQAAARFATEISVPSGDLQFAANSLTGEIVTSSTMTGNIYQNPTTYPVGFPTNITGGGELGTFSLGGIQVDSNPNNPGTIESIASYWGRIRQNSSAAAGNITNWATMFGAAAAEPRCHACTWQNYAAFFDFGGIIASQVVGDTGHIINKYGVYIGAMAGSATNPWAWYSVDSPSYFGGPLTTGSTLNVTGIATLAGNIALPGANNAGQVISANLIPNSGDLGISPATVNQPASILVYPNGASNSASFTEYNTSNPLNAAAFRMRANGTSANLYLFVNGTGTAMSSINYGEITACCASALLSQNFMFNGVIQASLSNVGKWIVASQQVTGLSTGIAHYDSSGNLTSSTVSLIADITSPGALGTFVITNNTGGLNSTTGVTTPDGNMLSTTAGFSANGQMLFSSATANTGYFQTQTTNAATVVKLYANGTGNNGELDAGNNSDTTNTNITNLRFLNSGSTATAFIDINKRGTGGTALTLMNIGEGLSASDLISICFYFHGVCQGTLSSVGNWTVARVTLPLASRIVFKTGSNGTVGTGTLSGGTLAVANTSVTASSYIFVQDLGGGTNFGTLEVTQTAGTGFTVTSSNASDTSSFKYVIFETN